MGEQKEKIMSVLRFHKGRGNPITAKALSKRLCLPEREVRRIISRLVTEQKLLIASSVHEPFGFYLIKTPYELRGCLGQYYSRMKTLEDRTSSLCKAGIKEFGKKALRGFKLYDYLK